MDLSKMSCVQWFGGTEKHRCGYCKNENGSISHGMWAETLSVQDYQDLIDRGWRRSGKYCYKPVMDETCCPQYTIKCDVSNFSLSKSQKKVIKKFNTFLKDDKLNKSDIPSEAQIADGYECPEIYAKDIPNLKSVNINCTVSKDMGDQASCSTNIEKNEGTKEELCDKPESKSSPPVNTLRNSFSKGKGADLNKPPCKKAKIMRLERKKENMLKKGLPFEKNEAQGKKTIEQFLEDICSNTENKLEVKLQRMSKTNGHFEMSAELFKKYQMYIHNDTLDECNKEQFFSFLVQSPLEGEDFPDGIEGQGFGSFHQQYWLNEKLIAVGVIDVLPKCVSSVYFFYDPDYRNLTLGTYGSLREVQYTRSLQQKLPAISEYYMGYYIHSCPKMLYKGKLIPSFLLCPETYCWVPIEKCLGILDSQKYSRLNKDLDALDENVPKISKHIVLNQIHLTK
ncbi:hypothetical protein JTB14_005669 [Gonioctena quinquepunctata]|nr:hypothetical protein JTB14_005669 [Gonioctena quinquepunctata]